MLNTLIPSMYSFLHLVVVWHEIQRAVSWGAHDPSFLQLSHHRFLCLFQGRLYCGFLVMALISDVYLQKEGALILSLIKVSSGYC